VTEAGTVREGLELVIKILVDVVVLADNCIVHVLEDEELIDVGLHCRELRDKGGGGWTTVTVPPVALSVRGSP